MKQKNFFGVLVLFCFGICFISLQSVASHSSVVISEIGAYEKQGHEWVEIVNNGTEQVDISGWKFWESTTNHGLTLVRGEDTILLPGAYAIITQDSDIFLTNFPNIAVQVFDSSWQNLNESGEEIGLIDAEGALIETFTYIAAPDFSLQRKDAHLDVYDATNWGEHVDGNSMGVVNVFVQDVDEGGEEPEGNPQEEIEDMVPYILVSSSTVFVDEQLLFDGSTSTSTGSNIVSYIWDMGDGAVLQGVTTTHAYTTSGEFIPELTITDTLGNLAVATKSITVLALSEEDVPEENNQQEPQDGNTENQEEQAQATSSTAHIVINEIVTDPESDEQEWIELYNTSSTTVDLTGWVLEDGVGQIAAPTSTMVSSSFYVVELSSSKLNNAGDILVIKNPNGIIIDQVSYGNWDDGNMSDNALKPEKGQSLARIVDGQDSGIDVVDFSLTTAQTKGLPNNITAPVVEQTPPASSGGGGGGGAPARTRYTVGQVVINEIVSDPSDGGNEFIELFNTTDRTIPLSGWYVEDGGEARTALTGSLRGSGFFVIENPRGHLNNAGDSVVLYDSYNTVIDRMTYGTWDDGNVANNAVVPRDPKSLARKVDGLNSGNDMYDFVLTDTVTKGAANRISEAVAQSNTDNGSAASSTASSQILHSVFISEILPNPEGSDREDEYIEVYNASEDSVDLAGFSLGDGSSRRYTITQGLVQPGEYYVVRRETSGIALNNTGGDRAVLYDVASRAVDTVVYAGSAEEGESYAKNEQGVWVWTYEVTPGEANIFARHNVAPSIIIDTKTDVIIGETIALDASDSVDLDGDVLRFFWTIDSVPRGFGDTITHTFFTRGQKDVTLAVSDGVATSTEHVFVFVTDGQEEHIQNTVTDAAESLQISEIFPNPVGTDAAEFVEIYNPLNEEVSLAGIKIDDEEGGSRGYAFGDGDVIAANSYKIIEKKQSSIAYNNTSDSARLLFADGSVITEVRYDDVKEGASFVFDATKQVWVWTADITPGLQNSIAPIQQKEKKRINTSVRKTKRIKKIIEVPLTEIREQDIGDSVKTSGIVAVMPGVLGSQYFYIVGSPGVQVYMHKKNFPEFALGDEISVVGEISQVNGEARVKVKESTDITVLTHPGVPDPILLDVSDVHELYEGWLAQVSGEVTEVKGSHFYLDDGTEEVKVYLKRGTGLTKKDIIVGNLVQVSGIIGKTRQGYQLLPRSVEDVVHTGSVVKSGDGESVNVVDKDVKDGSSIKRYLLVTLFGLLCILFALTYHVYGARIGVYIKTYYNKYVRHKK
ncbi:MAG: PKD domain-containing protein [Candidatus Magasanikbacteria bacterium]|nr:PKD domain-containing protein [Candidatus Magasanikbacteria bacterium]